MGARRGSAQVQEAKARQNPDTQGNRGHAYGGFEHAEPGLYRGVVRDRVRTHEVVALKLKDVKPTNDHYTLWCGKVKVEGQEHEGYFIDGAQVLREWLKSHPFRDNPESPLFPTWNGEHLGKVTAWGIVKSTARRAHIAKKVWPHLLRHSRATHLLQTGVSEAVVKTVLGWSPGSTELARYSHLTSKTAKNAYLKALGKEPEKVEVEAPVNFNTTSVGASKPVMARPPVAPPQPTMTPVEWINSENAASTWLVVKALMGAPDEFKQALRRALDGGSSPRGRTPGQGPRPGLPRGLPPHDRPQP